MPAGSAAARIEAIESEGAEVTLVDGSYDDAVEQARAGAGEAEWYRPAALLAPAGAGWEQP